MERKLLKLGDTVYVRAVISELEHDSARVYVSNGGLVWAKLSDIVHVEAHKKIERPHP